MKIHLTNYYQLRRILWDERFKDPIKESIHNIIHKYKNKEDYIQEILTLREVLIKCNDKFIGYKVTDEYDREFIRLIEDKVSDDVKYLFFTLVNEILTDNPIEDVPNIILLEYGIFRKDYIKRNIIKKDYGFDMDEEYLINHVVMPHYTENDMSQYLIEKHHGHIRCNMMEYLEDDTLGQTLVDSIMEYQIELIELCPMNIDVEDIETFTHPESELKLRLLPSVSKHIVPLIHEILAIPLDSSS